MIQGCARTLTEKGRAEEVGRNETQRSTQTLSSLQQAMWSEISISRKHS